MNTNDKIDAAFLQIAEGFKALSEPLTEALGQRPAAFAPPKCPHYWGQVINRCTRPADHNGEHIYAIAESAIPNLPRL